MEHDITSTVGPHIAVILPSLNPTEKLMGVIRGLIQAGFECIVLVNDGSDENHTAPFRETAGLSQCHILTHPVNRGKGAALKTAFDYLLAERPDILGAVTVDGDGQHLPGDVFNCGREMLADRSVIIGTRDFSLPGIPLKSRMGNRITSFVFRFGCGIKLRDTQTGLRAIPAEYFPFMLAVRGDRFEYETNMLLEMKRAGIPFRQVGIETVYEGKNGGSHFRPFRDSFRIYSLILKYMASSIASFLIDIVLFCLMHILLGRLPESLRILLSTAAARALSSFFNFNVNRRVVFSSREGYRRSLLKYYLLCIPQLLISAGLVSLLSFLFGEDASLPVTLIKLVIDICLFFISFTIQREWVFKKRR